jgi:hypothetical protein
MCIVWLSLMKELLIIFANFKLADESPKFNLKVKKKSFKIYWMSVNVILI